MYHILVVDDEKLMRTYLADNIPRFTDRFQVSGVAGDGLEAIELLRRQHFDVVITDIKMPEVDGLSLAKYIADNYPGIIVIIISGYDDFEYAQTAIRYHVTDYLLKPLVDQNLTVLLETIAGRLDEQHSHAFLSTAQNSTQTNLREALLEAVLAQNTALTYHLFQQLESCGLPCEKGFYMLLQCMPDTLDLLIKNRNASDTTTDHLRLNQILKALCLNHGYTALYNTDGSTYVLLYAPDSSLLPNRAQELYRELAKQTSSGRLPKVTVYGSQIVNDMMMLPYARQEIHRLAPLSLFHHDCPLLSSQTEEDEALIHAVNALSEQIYTDYLTASADHLYLDIGKLISLVHQNAPLGETADLKQSACPLQAGYASILRLGSYLITAVCGRARLSPAYQRKAYAELFRQIDLYMPAGLPDETTSRQILTNTISTLVSSPARSLSSEPGDIAAKAQKYILSHYQENISLSDVAAHCGINSSYLSDLFHKTLKEPYTKYLLRIRMEQAARLLRQTPDIRIYTVAEQTGFVSVKHFNAVFKKYYGVTPKEFMRGKNYEHP